VLVIQPDNLKNRVKERFFPALIFILLNVASFRLHTKNGVMLLLVMQVYNFPRIEILVLALYAFYIGKNIRFYAVGLKVALVV
jgi:hypothetical protein